MPAARWRAEQTPPILERVASEEGGDRVPAPVPGGERWHRERGVLGQQREDRVDVAALPGVDIALRKIADALVAELAQGEPLRPVREPLRRRLAPTSQRAVDRRDGSPQEIGFSRAEKPSTSRRINTARWLAGRCCSAAMKASSTLSLCSKRASGAA